MKILIKSVIMEIARRAWNWAPITVNNFLIMIEILKKLYPTMRRYAKRVMKEMRTSLMLAICLGKYIEMVLVSKKTTKKL